MRIALLADPVLPVPPRFYGGIERVIDFLAEGLTARGHDVTLFAHHESRPSCRLVSYAPPRLGAVEETARNAALVARELIRGRFDVVHSFARLAYLAPLAVSPVFKVMSYQRAITPRSVVWASRIFGRSIQFTACGRHMIAAVESLAAWQVVQNGVPLDRYTFRASVPADAPLMFLGRLEPIKGAHLAISTARRAGRCLVLAGNVPDEHRSYFEREIRPHVDDVDVKFVGPVDDVMKNALLGSAAALLMPIQWEEPFGIVMAEALACGTPVIGFDRASVPEVVQDGVNGLLVADVDGMAEAVARIAALDRRACRESAERRFSADVVVEAYESIYESGIARNLLAAVPGGARQ